MKLKPFARAALPDSGSSEQSSEPQYANIEKVNK